MNDDVVGRALEEIEALLPPRATEYRVGEYRAAEYRAAEHRSAPYGSGPGALEAVGSGAPAGGARDEPATIPLTVPPLPLQPGPA